MGVQKPDKPPDPEQEGTPLAPGVWVTETTGFASVPPRAQSDLQDAAKDAADKAEDGKDETTGAGETKPRIERYRDR